MSATLPDSFTYRVGELIDRARAQLAQLGNPQLPIMVEGFVSFNTQTAKYDQKYFSLCQYNDANSPVGKPIAKLEAVIFSNRFAVMSSQLRQVGLTFSPDLRAVFLGHLDIYKPFGKLQLVVTGIDLERTRQITEGAKDLLRAKLKAEGIFDANRLMRLPAVPLRIALVTSRGSAAESDFMTKLQVRRYRFSVEKFYVNTSGQNVSFSVPEAMVQINSRHTQFDLVVLARGGGDHVDLANFSLEGPVRSVASCAVPVWAAIGHSTDDVLVNEVANRVLANPNDAASELNGIVEGFLVSLAADARRLADESRRTLERAELGFGRRLSLLHGAASSELRNYRTIPMSKSWELRMRASDSLRSRGGELEKYQYGLTDLAARIVESSSSALATLRLSMNADAVLRGVAAQDLVLKGLLARLRDAAWESWRSGLGVADLARTRIEGVDPDAVLGLGYALLFSGKRRIASASELVSGDFFEARMADGSIWGEVISQPTDA